LGGIEPEQAIAAATGNAAAAYGLHSGLIAPGRSADIVLIDACDGGTTNDALSALANGDIAAVGAVVIDGMPRFVGRSRNTPRTTRQVVVAVNRLPHEFGGGLD
jgi:enamidase